MKNIFSGFSIVFLLMLITGKLQAQTFSLSGTVSDASGAALIGANAIVLKTTDSSIVNTGITDLNGMFQINSLQPGNYILKILSIGYEDKFKNISISDQSLNIGKLTLVEKNIQLKSVSIEGKIPPATQIGDTTQFNSNAFKTNPDANAEDLIAKLPGVTTTDGKVQAQGEDIKTVLVDGKPFFGDDPSAVLKNLPADVIDKIQVFDKRSDQSQFTGFDDGNTSKTINIITKPQFRNGTFGKMYAGYGIDDESEDSKYKSGVTLNFFKDKRRISILAQSNDINEQNFSSEDLLGVLSSSSNNRQGGQRGNFGGGQGGPRGGGGGRQGGGQNDASTFLVDQKNGINTTHAIGLNFSDQWKKTEVTGSYFFNYTDNTSASDLSREYINSDALIYNEQSKTSSRNINHRVNLKFNYKIDSLNSILFQPRFSAQINDGNSTLSGTNSQADTLLSNTSNLFSSGLDAITFSAPLLYRHSFLKKGRTFSINIAPGYTSNKGNSVLNTVSDYFDEPVTTDILNQSATLKKESYTLSSSLNYTEPLDTNNSLQFSYNNNINRNNSDKQTFDQSTGGEYDSLNNLLSSKFESRYISHSGGLGYRYQKGKLNLSVGAAYQWAELQNDQTFPADYELRKDFASILPNAFIMYKFTEKKNLRLFYRSNNNVPSVDQLQEVINNSNPLQLSIGNTALKQDQQNSVNIRYSAVNTEKNSSFFILLGGTFTDNYVANSTIFANSDTVVFNNINLQQGAQITRPVNLNGYYNIRSFMNYSFYIKPIKSNLNINAGITYSRTPGFIDDDLNYSMLTSPNGGITISSNISKKVDFTLSTNSAYNFTDNSLSGKESSNYFNQTSRAKINVMPWKGLVLQSDLTHQFYSGISGSENQDYYLWNAAIAYKFMKNDLAELRLSVNDILQQNTNIARNTTDTYTETTTSNVLQRYFMLTFTYNLKAFNQPKSAPAGN